MWKVVDTRFPTSRRTDPDVRLLAASRRLRNPGEPVTRLRRSARVLDARLWADRPAADDPGLYPSDHVGITATIEVG